MATVIIFMKAGDGFLINFKDIFCLLRGKLLLGRVAGKMILYVINSKENYDNMSTAESTPGLFTYFPNYSRVKTDQN